MQRRNAFTLKELMISVAIMGVLFAVLSPFVSRAREIARKMSCSNNLSELGLAIHNYHAAFDQLPQAMFGTSANEHRLNGMITLTRMFECTLWERVDRQSTYHGVDYPRLGPVPWDKDYLPWATDVPTFRCPSDGARGPLGRTNYALCVGDQVRGLYEFTSENEIRGMFIPARALRLQDVDDGLSNTIMMTEIGTAHRRRVQGQFVRGGPLELADQPSLCLESADDHRHPFVYPDHVTLDQMGRGGAFADGSGGFSLVHTILPPNSPSCAIGLSDPLEGVFSSGSYHADGCYILMGDGAAIFIHASIDNGDLSAPSLTVARKPGLPRRRSESPYGLWGALGTRASGEIVEEQVCH